MHQEEKLYLTTKEASKMYGYSVAWFAKLRYKSKSPPYICPNNGRILYPIKELAEWFRTKHYIIVDNPYEGDKIIPKQEDEMITKKEMESIKKKP